MNRLLKCSLFAFGTVAVLVGCSSNGYSASSSSSNTSNSSPVSAGAPAPATASNSSASTGGGALGAASNTKIGQTILVDGKGMTVYLYAPDGTSTSSTVPASIKSLWPAVPATTGATVGAGVDGSKFSAQPQQDGTTQAMYNGHLLYTFANDHVPGDANGQGLGGVWFVLSPAGDKIG